MSLMGPLRAFLILLGYGHFHHDIIFPASIEFAICNASHDKHLVPDSHVAQDRVLPVLFLCTWYLVTWYFI